MIEKQMLFFCLFIISIFNALGAEQKRPNIIFLMADDLSPMWFSAYGERSEVKTPNFDRMVDEGVGFSNAWCTPMCSPTRALVLTGQYGMRTGWLHNALKVSDNKKNTDFLANGADPFLRQMKKAGYKTAFCGRWGIPANWNLISPDIDEYCNHISTADQLPDGYELQEIIEENDRIFALINGTPEGSTESKTLKIRIESKEGYAKKPFFSRYWNPSISLNGKLLDTDTNDFGADIFTDFVLDFANRNKEDPFIIYYPMFLTHGIADKKSKDKLPKPPHLGQPSFIRGGTMKDCSEYVDVVLGKIMNGLIESELSENTIFIFNSDNGDCVYGKTHATAKGARVPYAIWGPGLVKQRGMINNLTEFSDLFPTILDLGNAPAPSQILDGTSIKDFIVGDSEKTRSTIFSYIGTARMARNKDFVLEAVDPIFNAPKGRLLKTNGETDPAKFKKVKTEDYPEAYESLLSQINKLPQADYGSAYAEKAFNKYKKLPAKFRHKLE